jgi:triacylglycerol lipase
MTEILAVADKSLSYVRTGSGPAVVIIHGVGGHKEDWSDVARLLATHHTVYAVDMLGFGGSSKTGSIITIDDQAAAILALLDGQKVPQADVIGNSVGGWVAATFAARYPQRVRKLILVDAAGFKAMFEGPIPVEFYPQSVEAMQKLLEFVRSAPDTHTPAYAAKALAAFQASGDAAAADAVGKGLFASTRLEEIAEQISAPTLIVWGAEDRLFPPAIADLVASHLRGSLKVLIPHAGHFPQLDNPQEFNRVIGRFLAS